MIHLKCNQPVYCDVDDTLILWRPSEELKAKYGVAWRSVVRTAVLVNGKAEYLETEFSDSFVPNLPQIEQIKEHKRRGHTIIVWSAGGDEWANEAVKLLGLENYVDLALEKPHWAYDDKKAEEFMPKCQLVK